MSNVKPVVAFNFGRIHMTRGAERLHQQDVASSLLRHIEADWGDLEEHDWKANDDALAFGAGLLSSYVDRNNKRFWIITESDRSATTILLPDEY